MLIDPLLTAEIQASTDCPKCMAKAGKTCKRTKANKGQLHRSRYRKWGENL